MTLRVSAIFNQFLGIFSTVPTCCSLGHSESETCLTRNTVHEKVYLMHRCIWESLEAFSLRSPLSAAPDLLGKLRSRVRVFSAFMSTGPSVDWEQSCRHMLLFLHSAIEKMPSVCTFIIFPAWLNFL
jgi:hypothetical protein